MQQHIAPILSLARDQIITNLGKEIYLPYFASGKLHFGKLIKLEAQEAFQ